MTNTSKRTVAFFLIGICVLAGAAILIFQFSPKAHAQTAYLSLTGWVWSDNIGWISMNCANTDSCAVSDYGISIGSDGTLSGYAWSDNIGWVSANDADVASCYQNYGGGDPQIQSNGELTGWLRALSGNTDQSGGWDGCISLNGSDYGVTVGGGGTFSGFAWGDINVGWADFSLVQESTNPVCPVGFVQQNDACVFSSCPAGFSQETDANGNPECVQSSCGLGYTLENGGCNFTGCPAGYSLEGSQCVLLGSPVPEGDVVAVPTLLQSGNTTQVSWSASDVSSCLISGTNGDSWSCTGQSCAATSTEVSKPITGQTLYTLLCKGNDGSAVTDTAVVNIVPSFEEQ